MRKLGILLTVIVLIVITGCSKKEKLTCNGTQTFSDAEMKTETVVTFKNGYATSYKTTMNGTFTSEEFAQIFADKYKKSGEYKVKVNGNKVELVSEVKEKKNAKKIEENKKSNVKTYLEGKGYTCK